MPNADQSAESANVTRRRVLRTAAIGAGSVLLVDGVLLAGAGYLPAAHAASEPHVHTRGEWGARKPKRDARVNGAGPDHIVVHHTATPNSSSTSTKHAAALSRSIQKHHMDGNGWDDAGQHLTISRGGHIMEGRNRSLSAIRQRNHVVGAHTANHNSHTVGIENEGTYSSATPPNDLFQALADTCAWLCLVYGLNPDKAIVGHRDYSATSCPGDKLYAMLPQLRRDVGSRLRSLNARVEQLNHGEIPRSHLPTFPEVPEDERAVEFYHGPALGARDRTSG